MFAGGMFASVMSEASRRFEPSNHYVRYNLSLKAPVAQWIERQPSKLRVRGSSPFRRATSPRHSAFCGGCSSVWLERQVVALEAAGSNPVIHPKPLKHLGDTPRKPRERASRGGAPGGN